MAMTRYYFHIHDHGALIPDDEGLELSGIGAARAECILSVNDLLLADRRSGRVSSTMVEIADGHGRMLDAMPVRRVLH
jgi:hypothetical protein